MNSIMNSMLFALLLPIFSFAQDCTITAPSIVCQGEKIHVEFTTAVEYDQIDFDALTVKNGQNFFAIVENETENGADIIFPESGDGEIIIRYFKEGILQAFCNQNVFVFGGEGIPALGEFSTIVGDKEGCGNYDLEFQTFVACPDCPIEWFLNDSLVSIETQNTLQNNVVIQNGSYTFEELGEYTLCQRIYKPDLNCYAEDCISIVLTPMDDIPAFSILEEEDVTFCLPSEISFENQSTTDKENVLYNWSVTYDTLTWNYIYNDLSDFDFNFNQSGDYEVSLQMALQNNLSCASSITTMPIEISTIPQTQITCSTSLCDAESYKYQISDQCSDIEWEFDESLVDSFSVMDHAIIIYWKDVNTYTETTLKAFVNDCEGEVCESTSRKVKLFPIDLQITGPQNLCSRGIHDYFADDIPGAQYSWEIRMIDSIRGLTPTFSNTSDHLASINFRSYLGTIEVICTASIPSRNCEVTSSIIVQSYGLRYENNLCPNSIFVASVDPNFDENIIWTITNEDTDYHFQTTLPGSQSLITQGFPEPGIYEITLEIPGLDFSCDFGGEIAVIGNTNFDIDGPTLVCLGQVSTYSIPGLQDNQTVSWTIYQGDNIFQSNDDEINVVWEENHDEYIVKAVVASEVEPGIFCNSIEQTIEISAITPEDWSILGDQDVCYDALSTYSFPQQPSGASYEWSIEPEFMGSITNDIENPNPIVQWHYNPSIPSAILRSTVIVCGEEFTFEKTIIFTEVNPTVVVETPICAGNASRISMPDLENFQSVNFYVNDELVLRDRNAYNLNEEAGFHTVRIEVIKPNDCPHVFDTTFTLEVLDAEPVKFDFSHPFPECEGDEYDPVTIYSDIIDPSSFYTWILNGDTIKTGFGSEELYSLLFTEEYYQIYDQVQLVVTFPNGCSSTASFIILNSNSTFCECNQAAEGEITYLEYNNCNTISFGAEVENFNSIDNLVWILNNGNSIIEIPILTEDDLQISNLTLADDFRSVQIILSYTCEGIYTDVCAGIEEEAICSQNLDFANAVFLYPRIEAEYLCQENNLYTVFLEEINSNEQSNFEIEWTIDGQNYSGYQVILEDIEGGSTLDIEITKCHPGQEGCCTLIDTFKIQKTNTIWQQLYHTSQDTNITRLQHTYEK